MLNYEKFKEKMKNVIEDYFADVQAIEGTRIKVNSKSERLILKKGSVCPSINLESEYEVYKEVQDDEAYFKRILKIANNAFEDAEKFEFDFDAENVTDKITFQLINAEKNKELLEKVPHKKFLDLAIIYRIVFSQEEKTLSSVISKETQLGLNLTDENLFTLSASNTLKTNPPQIFNMYNPFDIGFLDDLREVDLEEQGSGYPMYIITNKSKVYGAGSMLYVESLHKLATKLNSDLMILPSSIHEVIAIPDNNADINELRNMVKTVNDTYVKGSEILSYNLYRYSRDTKRITIVEGENGR